MVVDRFFPASRSAIQVEAVKGAVTLSGRVRDGACHRLPSTRGTRRGDAIGVQTTGGVKGFTVE